MPSFNGSLTNVSILITTFLRDGCLLECIRRIQAHFPEVTIVVVDDGYPTTEKQELAKHLNAGGHEYIVLPFDSGLPAKRNAGVKVIRTRYMLMGCDDFDFSPIEARLGIEKMRGILDLNPEIDVASGRRANEPYEGFLSIVPGQYIKETSLVPTGNREFYKVDLTVNYFLARTNIVQKFPWDERMKIGGEHGDWFLDLKNADRHVVWVPGVNITELQVPNGEHPDYAYYRARARDLGHKIFLAKRGVMDYKGFGS